MQRFTWNANGYPNFGQPIPVSIAITNPSGDDFTPALIQSVAMQTNGRAQVAARPPLPLLTNKWTIQFSPDLKSWTTLTNLPGTQFSATIPDSQGASRRFYRVKSSR
jgi:hypothetical protein